MNPPLAFRLREENSSRVSKLAAARLGSPDAPCGDTPSRERQQRERTWLRHDFVRESVLMKAVEIVHRVERHLEIGIAGRQGVRVTNHLRSGAITTIRGEGVEPE